MMVEGVKFKSPPIVELVLGVQFTPLHALSTAHLGRYWSEVGLNWEPGDGPPIPDQFELFDRPPTPAMLRLQLSAMNGPGRLTFTNEQKDRLIQVQASRFHLNWRRCENIYPRYENLIGEFETAFGRFSAFTEACGLGKPVPNQWELTYIDAFPKGEHWNSVGDWPSILPGLFGSLFKSDEVELQLEQRRAEWVYEIGSKQGRLHVAGHAGRWNEKDSLLLQMTARGPIAKDGAKSLREGLDLGHKAALCTFLSVVAPEIRATWGVSDES